MSDDKKENVVILEDEVNVLFDFLEEASDFPETLPAHKWKE